MGGIYFKDDMLLCSLDISFLKIRCYIRVMKISFSNGEDYLITSAIMP